MSSFCTVVFVFFLIVCVTGQERDVNADHPTKRLSPDKTTASSTTEQSRKTKTLLETHDVERTAEVTATSYKKNHEDMGHIALNSDLPKREEHDTSQSKAGRKTQTSEEKGGEAVVIMNKALGIESDNSQKVSAGNIKYASIHPTTYPVTLRDDKFKTHPVGDIVQNNPSLNNLKNHHDYMVNRKQDATKSSLEKEKYDTPKNNSKTMIKNSFDSIRGNKKIDSATKNGNNGSLSNIQNDYLIMLFALVLCKLLIT